MESNPSSDDEEEPSESAQGGANAQVGADLDLRAHDTQEDVSIQLLEPALQSGRDLMQTDVPGPRASSRYHPSAVCPRSPGSVHEGIVYKWTNKVNGKGYVGKTVNEYQRHWQHKTGKTMRGKKKGKMQLIDMKIQQYGIDAFKYEVLEDNIPKDQLLAAEAKWMKSENTLVPNGYNILPPGVEVVSMSDPVIRARWEASNPEGVRKATATKRAQREEKLAQMPDQAQAAELRIQLDKMSERGIKKRKGEDPGPDGRFGRNDKRRATWEAKRQAKLSTMSAAEQTRYLKKCALRAKYSERKADDLRRKNQQPAHVAWMKEYRKRNRGVHLPK